MWATPHRTLRSRQSQCRTQSHFRHWRQHPSFALLLPTKQPYPANSLDIIDRYIHAISNGLCPFSLLLLGSRYTDPNPSVSTIPHSTRICVQSRICVASQIPLV